MPGERAPILVLMGGRGTGPRDLGASPDRRAVDARLTQMDERVRLVCSHATALLRSIGIDDPVTVSVSHEFNHVYWLPASGQVFHPKTHTKAWYRGDARAPATCVIHEQCAWDILAGHGVPTPEMVLVASDGGNAFGRPFIVTSGLAGAPLTDLLDQATEAEQRQLLVATGSATT